MTGGDAPGLPDARAAALAARLAPVHARAFTMPRPWSQAEFAALLSAPGVILCGDTGAFVLGRVTLDEAEVLTLATDPALRRQGRARAALEAFHAAAAAAGAVSCFLEVAEDNAAARALYAAAGYAPVGRRPGYFRAAEGHDVAAIVMRRPLGPVPGPA